MGTKGCWGFRINGEDKVTYSHFDAYPTGLGQDLTEDLSRFNLEQLKQQVQNLRMVSEYDQPTEQDKKQLQKFTDLSVSSQSDNDWYCLLRETQGNLSAVLEAGILINNQDFLKNSLFCQWAYIINLDENTFEVYRGCQRQLHYQGRYASSETKNDYYPVALYKTFKLDNIPVYWAHEIEQEVYS